MKQAIKLGDEVKDKVTGFKGIVISEVKYLNGCLQYGVKPKVGKDGKMPEVEYIDVDQVELINEKTREATTAPDGGIQPDAPKI